MSQGQESAGCAGRTPTVPEFFDGIRGTVVYDDTRGTPERTKGSRKSRASNGEGWTPFDLKMARDRGVSLETLNGQRAASRAWIEEFRERVRLRMEREGVRLDAPIPGFDPKNNVPF